MIRFLLNSAWRLFLLFFFMNILSSWSKLPAIFVTCQRAWADDDGTRSMGGTCDYGTVITRLLRLVFAAASASLMSVIEIGNLLALGLKSGTAWLRRRTLNHDTTA